MNSRALPCLCNHGLRRSTVSASSLAPIRELSYFSRSKRFREVPKTTITPQKKLNDFYEDLTSQPMASPPTSPTTKDDSAAAKARLVFGSKLTAQADRRRELEANSKSIAGVLVPPRPAEPENCCMSGCVNCVWDQYRDELEEWAAKSVEARAQLDAQGRSGLEGDQRPRSGAMAAEIKSQMSGSSREDDTGGSETLAAPASEKTEELFDDIPVGIREFMRMEKKMREKKRTATIAAP